jgi:hypothetical protein
MCLLFIELMLAWSQVIVGRFGDLTKGILSLRWKTWRLEDIRF